MYQPRKEISLHQNDVNSATRTDSSLQKVIIIDIEGAFALLHVFDGSFQ